MTAAIGAEVAGAAGASEGAAAAGASRASAAAPSASAPVGTARAGAGRPGTKPRTQNELRPLARKPPDSGASTRTRATKAAPAKKAAPARSAGVTTGKTTTTTSKGGKQVHTTSTKRSMNPLFFGGRGGRGGRGGGAAGSRKLLLAEFVVCILITAFSPLTDKHKSEPFAQQMKRHTAVSLLFLVLALVSSAGRGASRVAAAFGGLVTVALLVSDRDIFGVIAKRIGSPPAAGPAGPPGPGGEAPPSEEGGAPAQPSPPTFTDPNGGGWGFPNPVPPGQWWNPGPL